MKVPHGQCLRPCPCPGTARRPSTFPNHRILDLDVPDDAITAVSAPFGNTRQIGTELLRAHLAIMAPSSVNPLERNVVINPVHAEFEKVIPGTIRTFEFDRRLVA